MTEKSILVVEFEDLRIYKWSYCYVVGVLTKKKNGTEYLPEWSKTYHRSLVDAVSKLSERIIERKLEKRAEDGKSDLKSLVKLIQDHRAQMDYLFGLHGVRNSESSESRFQRNLDVYDPDTSCWRGF